MESQVTSPAEQITWLVLCGLFVLVTFVALVMGVSMLVGEVMKKRSR